MFVEVIIVGRFYLINKYLFVSPRGAERRTQRRIFARSPMSSEFFFKTSSEKLNRQISSTLDVF
jgi:hypothetical protein